MAEPSTIARPYAEAVFKLADAQGKLADWASALANLAAVASDDRIRAAVADPNLPAAKAAGLFISVLAGKRSLSWRKSGASACLARSAGTLFF